MERERRMSGHKRKKEWVSEYHGERAVVSEYEREKEGRWDREESELVSGYNVEKEGMWDREGVRKRDIKKKSGVSERKKRNYLRFF